MNGRPWGALALLACGGLLLAATQTWVRTLEEVADGAPRTRGAVAGAELVPWLVPVALVTALAVVAGLTGARWVRPVAGAAALVVLAGAVSAVAAAASAGTGSQPVVSSSPTGWLWVGVVAAGVTALGTLAWWGTTAASVGRRGAPHARSVARVDDRPSGGASGQADPRGCETERRRTAAHWRDLSEGRDPTDH